MGASAQAVWLQGEICGWVNMIFVTVGNDFRSFDRLLKKMDEITPLLQVEVVIQRGYSKYLPRNAKHFDFVPLPTAIEYIQKSELVVSHAGIGTIILCKEYGIPILIFPRRKGYGEHMNDHQMEIAKALEERRDENIHMIYQEDQLEEKILKILGGGRRNTPAESIGKANLIKTIKEFVNRSQS
jgi:UDP-N-acetylglucosamine transferase subunit ALG13